MYVGTLFHLKFYEFRGRNNSGFFKEKRGKVLLFPQNQSHFKDPSQNSLPFFTKKPQNAEKP